MLKADANIYMNTTLSKLRNRCPKREKLAFIENIEILASSSNFEVSQTD